ncbi:hypothetical protein SDC9_168351 [bioreactor metagenome]|uniref:Uncharacterized protein n=1 Tax=bioreactor metagenome TaxID=1076179 RepID=A0A645G4T6_9ZZZZ
MHHIGNKDGNYQIIKKLLIAKTKKNQPPKPKTQKIKPKRIKAKTKIKKVVVGLFVHETSIN